MGPIDFGGGWSPYDDIELSVGAAPAEPIQQLTPEQALVAGIANKNAEQVRQAFAHGAPPGLRVGQDKLVTHVARFFDPEVAKICTDAKMSWVDPEFWGPVLDADNAAATQWILHNTPWSREMKNWCAGARDNKFNGVLDSMWSRTTVHSLSVVFDVEPQTLEYADKVKGAAWPGLAWSAITQRAPKLCAWFRPEGRYEKRAGEALASALANSFLDKLTIPTWQALSDELHDNPHLATAFQRSFPRSVDMGTYVRTEVLSRIKAGVGANVADMFTRGNYHLDIRPSHSKANTVMDVLVRRAAPVLVDVAATATGRAAILASLSAPGAAMSFAFSAPEKARGITAVLGDEAFAWRDPDGNTLAHFLAVALPAHKTALGSLKTLHPTWLFEENAFGVSPLSLWPLELRAPLEKQQLKMATKGAIPASVAAPRRRM